VKISIVVMCLLIPLLFGCVQPALVQKSFDPAYPERNSNGDPIVAVFFGRIPCASASCEMRKVTLVLYGRDHGQVPTTYWLGQVGVGSGDDAVVTQGTWTRRHGVQGYPDATVYSLDSAADPTLQYLWRVNDEVMLVLGPDMRPKSGSGAWGYMLSRDCAPYGPRTYTYDQGAKRFVSPATDQSNCQRPASVEG
jgi:hypothetical protein